MIPDGQTALAGMIPSSSATPSVDDRNNGTAAVGGSQSALFTMTPGATTGGQTVNTATATTSNPTLDFGFNPRAASLGNKVWFDTNHDGIQDSTEVGVSGVRVTLLKGDGTAATDIDGAPVADRVTDSAGDYLFSNLPAGTYKVVFEAPATLPASTKFTTMDTGSEDADSDADPVTGMTATYTLADRQYDPRVDAGIFSTKGEPSATACGSMTTRMVCRTAAKRACPV